MNTVAWTWARDHKWKLLLVAMVSLLMISPISEVYDQQDNINHSAHLHCFHRRYFRHGGIEVDTTISDRVYPALARDQYCHGRQRTFRRG